MKKLAEIAQAVEKGDHETVASVTQQAVDAEIGEPTILDDGLLAGDGAPSRDVVVLGTVRGDLHGIGKNLVAIMLRGAGYRIVELGADVAPEQFVDAANAVETVRTMSSRS